MGDRHHQKQKACEPGGSPELRARGHLFRFRAGAEKKGHRRVVDGPGFGVIYSRLEGPAAADFAGGIDETSGNHQANPEVWQGQGTGDFL